MSSSTSGPRRRRIAGERNTARPAPTPDPADPSPEADGALLVASAGPGLEPLDPAVEPSASDLEPTDRVDEAARTAPRAVRPLTLVLLAVVAAVLVALAAGPFIGGVGVGAVRDVATQQALDDARRTAPAAAERAAAAILAYDHRSLEADRDAAARYMTEDYRKDYLDTFDGTVLEAAPELKARVRADVRASGVALAEEDRVEVLLFVNQTTVSTANSGEPQVALNRVMMTMERRPDGSWLVDGITSY